MTQDFLQTTTHTVAWLKAAADSDTLDMSPPFQRNPVWLTPQKSFLIETILKGYPVPEVYLQTSADERGIEQHVVVDGQQRIRACLEFVVGEYALVGLQNQGLNDQSFDDLSAAERKTIFNYKFIVRLLPDISTDEIRTIFQRLNQNVVALNRQELRHATYWGVFIKLVEELARLDYWRSSGIFTSNEIRRMLDIEFISELVVAMVHGPQNKKLSLERFYAAYEESFDEEQSIREQFPRVLDWISAVLPELNKTRWRKKSDFYTLFLCFAGFLSNAEARRTIGSNDTLSTNLIEFGEMVDHLVSLDAPEENTSNSAWTYARAVQRAASDLGNRRVRTTALTNYLMGFDQPIEPEQHDAVVATESGSDEDEDEYEEE